MLGRGKSPGHQAVSTMVPSPKLFESELTRRDGSDGSGRAMWCCAPTIDSEMANVLPYLGL